MKTLTHWKINKLVDVRSSPNSRFNPQFHKHNLVRFFTHENRNITYEFRGDKLGGFGKVGQPMIDGIKQLVDESAKQDIVIMCSEYRYDECHRHWWIARYAVEVLGIDVFNLRTGSTEFVERTTRDSFIMMKHHPHGKQYLGEHDIVAFGQPKSLTTVPPLKTVRDRPRILPEPMNLSLF